MSADGGPVALTFWDFSNEDRLVDEKWISWANDMPVVQKDEAKYPRHEAHLPPSPHDEVEVSADGVLDVEHGLREPPMGQTSGDDEDDPVAAQEEPPRGNNQYDGDVDIENVYGLPPLDVPLA